jgi:ADP-ribose pyrophosphatase YjhB (NUDIX family)
MTRTRVITAYGRLAGGTEEIGGPIRHGENPASAVVRLFAEQAGLAVAVSAVRDVRALITPDVHEDRVDFDVFAVSDSPLVSPPRPVGDGGLPKGQGLPNGQGLPKGQRFAAYGLVADPSGRILLTEIARGYPGAGRWHLPGGGTNVGEQPAEALLRELFEETGQRGEITGLLGVTHRRSPGAIGPEGYPIDWHRVRALYRVLVPVPSPPRVTEAAGGSTAAAAWFTPAELPDLSMTEVVLWAVTLPQRESERRR